MNPILCITFRFIQPFPLFHGSGNGGTPEWPPSPMRAFQSLVNATSLRHRGNPLPAGIEQALALIESIRPSIIAPDAVPSNVGYRAYVPHNQADLVSAGWYRGNIDLSIASHRTEKDIRPMLIDHTDGFVPELHYLFQLNLSVDESQVLLNLIRPCVRSISSLGWGIDLVVADATLLTENPLPETESHRWRPSTAGQHRMRVHREGSFQALRRRYDQFLYRLVDGRFSPVPPITAIDVVPYARETDPIPRPHAVFKLRDTNEDPARYPHAKLVHIAGMVRHLAIETMTKSPPPWIPSVETASFVNRFIRGKRDPSVGDEHKQISYIPLPSIGHEHADGIIRNVLLVAPTGMERELTFLAKRIDGEMLKPEGEISSFNSDSSPMNTYVAELRLFEPPCGKFIATHYLGTSRVWHSVTPVILDGHNKKSKSDKLGAIARETDKLVCKALQRAGIETPCTFMWQPMPFVRNTLSAHKYDRDGRHTGYHRPTHLKEFTAIHIRITFEHAVPGPLALGAGRHCGFGLMAIADE